MKNKYAEQRTKMQISVGKLDVLHLDLYVSLSPADVKNAVQMLDLNLYGF